MFHSMLDHLHPRSPQQKEVFSAKLRCFSNLNQFNFRRPVLSCLKEMCLATFNMIQVTGLKFLPSVTLGKLQTLILFPALPHLSQICPHKTCPIFWQWKGSYYLTKGFYHSRNVVGHWQQQPQPVCTFNGCNFDGHSCHKVVAIAAKHGNVVAN